MALTFADLPRAEYSPSLITERHGRFPLAKTLLARVFNCFHHSRYSLIEATTGRPLFPLPDAIWRSAYQNAEYILGLDKLPGVRSLYSAREEFTSALAYTMVSDRTAEYTPIVKNPIDGLPRHLYRTCQVNFGSVNFDGEQGYFLAHGEPHRCDNTLHDPTLLVYINGELLYSQEQNPDLYRVLECNLGNPQYGDHMRASGICTPPPTDTGVTNAQVRFLGALRNNRIEFV